MSALTQYYLTSQASVVQLECLEISHPNFSQTYRLVRNNVAGVTVTHEDATSHAYTYYPMQITSNGAKDNLDASLQIAWGDLGDTLPAEIDAIATANNFAVKPVVKYRTYRSDDLTAPIFGPLTLEIKQITHNADGATFEAAAPQLNNSQSGELFDLTRFPMLRGFL